MDIGKRCDENIAAGLRSFAGVLAGSIAAMPARI